MFATCSNLATGEAKISGPHNMHRWQSCHALVSSILTFSPWIWAFIIGPKHLTRIHPCLNLPNMISQRSGLATATSLATPLTCCWPGWTEATATRRTRTASSPWSRCIRWELPVIKLQGQNLSQTNCDCIQGCVEPCKAFSRGARWMGSWSGKTQVLSSTGISSIFSFFWIEIEVLLSSTREQHKARSRELRDQCKSLWSMRLITYRVVFLTGPP